MKKQKNLLNLGLTLLIISLLGYLFFFRDLKEKILNVELGYGKYELFSDSTAILFDKTNEIAQKGKCSYLYLNNSIYFNCFKRGIMKYDISKDSILKVNELRGKTGEMGIKVYKHSEYPNIIFYHSNYRLVFLDMDLKSLYSPLDSIFDKNLLSRERIKSEWDYKFMKNDSLSLNFYSLENKSINFKLYVPRYLKTER
jgi:hypothetical protein